jgi:ABC-type multidrug transport system fused ATPase/permease subunit
MAADSPRGPLPRLLALAWHYRAECLRVFAGQLASLALGLGALGGSGLAIDVIRRAVDPAAPPVRWPLGVAPPAGWSTARALIAVVATALLFATLRARVVYGTAIATGRLIHIDLVPALRARVFDRLLRLGPGFFQRNASGSIINRVTSDVQSLRSFVDGVLLQGALLVFTLVVYVGYMVHVHVGLTAACLAPTPLLWLATSWFSRWARPAYEKNRGLSDAMVLAMSEGVKGMRVTKTFGAEAHELERFRRRNRAVRDQQEQIFRGVSRFSPAVSFITAIGVAILLLYGGVLVARNALTLGELVVFAGLLQQFSTQITGMATIVNTLEQSVTAARRVFEVLDAPAEVDSPAAPAPLTNCRGAVRFENVSFAFAGAHSGRLALDVVDFAVEPGRCVAFVGATGAGKSTLLALLPRFADPSRGRVLIDGVDIRALDVDGLRRNIGVVFQESLLFRGTVAENVAFGHPGASRAAIERAARTAGAHAFIAELPGGYDTPIEEAGHNLSGGQRQRLAIARAILLDPPILLLDDPTSAIDVHTEDEVLAAIEAARHGRTTILVTSRFSALRAADEIFVLDAGRIVERGAHATLARAGGLYAQAAALHGLGQDG